MKFKSILEINYKKLVNRSSKALYLIIPITVLFTLGIIISSQTFNIRNALDTFVFSKLKDQYTVISLTYQEAFAEQGMFGGSRNKNTLITQSGYTDTDVQKIKLIENITDASIIYKLPINNIKSTNLISEKEIIFSEIYSLNENMANIYTTEAFEYVEGEPIPIILNLNSFIERSENWGDKTEITIDMEEVRASVEQSLANNNNEEGNSTTDPRELLNQISPIQNKAIAINSEDILGKTFEISFGGLTELTDYTVSREGPVTTYTKLTDSEIETDSQERYKTIDQYWDYEKLNTPLTYTFKVVGIIEDADSRYVYVPEEFGFKVMQDYIENQISAQKFVNIDLDLLNSTFTGLTYDGSEVTNSLNSSGSSMPGGMPMGLGLNKQITTTSSNTYFIPGLVLKVSSSNTSEIESIVTDVDIFTNSLKRGNEIVIKINSLFDRTNVIASLNNNGYALQDINDMDVFDNIQKTLNEVTAYLVLAFTIISSSIILLLMSKNVSDSKKEIGIFRAIGFTKGEILTIFLAQGVLYTFIAYIIGMIIGVLGNILISSSVSMWFINFVNSTISNSTLTTAEISPNIFMTVDVNFVIILSIILFIVGLVASLLPSINASNITPVEAIKNE